MNEQIPDDSTSTTNLPEDSTVSSPETTATAEDIAEETTLSPPTDSSDGTESPSGAGAIDYKLTRVSMVITIFVTLKAIFV